MCDPLKDQELSFFWLLGGLGIGLAGGWESVNEQWSGEVLAS